MSMSAVMWQMWKVISLSKFSFVYPLQAVLSHPAMPCPAYYLWFNLETVIDSACACLCNLLVLECWPCQGLLRVHVCILASSSISGLFLSQEQMKFVPSYPARWEREGELCTHVCACDLAAYKCGTLFHTEGGLEFPPPPEILKFSMVFGQTWPNDININIILLTLQQTSSPPPAKKTCMRPCGPMSVSTKSLNSFCFALQRKVCKTHQLFT